MKHTVNPAVADAGRVYLGAGVGKHSLPAVAGNPRVRVR